MDRCVSTLDPADQIVVWACRNWLGGYERWRQAVSALSRRFEPAQGRILAFHLGALLALLAGSRSGRIVLGPAGSLRLWPGEAVLLEAIGLCRDGCADGADRLLARYLDPAARRLAVYHLHGVAASLAAAERPALPRAGRVAGSGSAGQGGGASATILPFPARPAAQAQRD